MTDTEETTSTLSQINGLELEPADLASRQLQTWL